MSVAMQMRAGVESEPHHSQSHSDPEVVELTLLIPQWQAQILESAAERRGMTTGQMLRRVISDLFGDNPQSRVK